MQPRVFLVDDHDLFRSGLRALLEAEEFAVGEATSGEAALRHPALRDADVVVLDLDMPGMGGVAATREITARHAVPVLVLSLTTSEDDVVAAVVAGASGYLVKEAPLGEIIAGIRAAAAGQTAIAPAVAGGLLARVRAAARPRTAPRSAALATLTERERSVLRLLAEGNENAGIGEALHLSASTIKSHVSAILQKLGAENRVQAAVLAFRGGLLDDAY
jgi:DNA-binding NarL/FixJ family response regulator